MIETLGKNAKSAAFELAKYATLQKNQFLQQLAQALIRSKRKSGKIDR